MGRQASVPPRGHALFRLALVGAVALGVPVAAADTAQAGSGGRCGSSGTWSTVTGDLQSSRWWKAHGGQGTPHRASRAEQIRIAQQVRRPQGWKAWPVCSRKLGLR